jgi:hypothetical protein
MEDKSNDLISYNTNNFNWGFEYFAAKFAKCFSQISESSFLQNTNKIWKNQEPQQFLLLQGKVQVGMHNSSSDFSAILGLFQIPSRS